MTDEEKLWLWTHSVDWDDPESHVVESAKPEDSEMASGAPPEYDVAKLDTAYATEGTGKKSGCCGH